MRHLSAIVIISTIEELHVIVLIHVYPLPKNVIVIRPLSLGVVLLHHGVVVVRHSQVICVVKGVKNKIIKLKE
jgi:hypothetical protein